jgi:hypothetical protein
VKCFCLLFLASLSLEILLHGHGETGHGAANSISRHSGVVTAQSMRYECMSFAVFVFILCTSGVIDFN